MDLMKQGWGFDEIIWLMKNWWRCIDDLKIR